VVVFPNRGRAENGATSCLAVIRPERQKFGSGPVGVRAVPGPQKRGTWGTQIFVWGGGPPANLSFSGLGSIIVIG
jgi:hypothetical protein